ncbi:MAG TPA: multicopper oxidase domain-containing protein, partial [Candidatus Binataceae bacterium]|nr:multicopper oxidase domain-containing protein [Candidatus Binataceae bacterium]
TISIGSGMTYAAWTYGGTVPGPLLRARQGDQVTVKLANHTASAHGLEIYAAQIAPSHFTGQLGMPELSYGFEAKLPGVFVYHCSAIPVLNHIAAGMYGMMIVDPSGGWPGGAAHEITMVQSEFYGTPDAHGFIAGDSKKMLDAAPDFVVFNGMVNRYDLENPIPIKVGELVRLFFINAGPNRFSVFHISGVIFSTVYRNGNPAAALHDVPSIALGPDEGAVFEFRVGEAGDYGFGDESDAHDYKGAQGIFRAAAK